MMLSNSTTALDSDKEHRRFRGILSPFQKSNASANGVVCL